MLDPSTLSILLCLLIPAVYAFSRWLLPKPIPGVAYNPAATQSIWGDALDMLAEVQQTGEFRVWCARQVQKMINAPLCQVFVRPFAKPWVLLADFREARDILMRRREFDKGTLIIDSMACLGEFHGRFRTGPGFKAHRQLIQDLMTASFLHSHAGPAIHAKGRDLLRLLGRKMHLAKGRPFEVHKDVEYVALDVMLEFSFGKKNWTKTTVGPQIELLEGLRMEEDGDAAAGLDEPVRFPESPIDESLRAVYEAPKVIERAVVAWSPRLSLWWWKKQRWYREVFAQKDRLMRDQIQRAVANYKAGSVESALEHMMVREAARAEKLGRQPDLQSHVLVDEIFGNVIAGHHTTSGAVLWVFKYLTDWPAVQAKLRAALHATQPDALREGRWPTFEELRRARLPYLDAVLEEVLRLNAVTVTRQALCDTEILGRPIPKGTEVFLVSNGPGFLAPPMPVDETKRTETSRAAKLRDTWDEEDRGMTDFEPERWLRKGEDGQEVEFDGAAGPQLVFGLGPRACWGRRLAMLEMRVLTALVLWRFELLAAPEKLSSYRGVEGIARVPQMCYLRLRDAPAAA
ncbi:cytochrome P450 [Aspergillus ellipticus CBS 707.79]|uniref:Cytochrome P450 n=1 Tax=Aspergillus ellipticus CBS 707.79 TaxID=1448320 RepID=A0A319CZL9_9EURO|nr:cytochrome P450 [Aspergillus ellipticus CBS 707.79]